VGPARRIAEIGCRFVNLNGGIDLVTVHIFDNPHDAQEGLTPLASAGVELIGSNWVATIKTTSGGGSLATLQALERALDGSVAST
jgi:hypothetical protein